jgi:putative oxidoreductase
MVQEWIAVLASPFLLAGLWTPLAATVAGLDELWMALSISSAPTHDMWIHVMLAVLAVSLAMLGPGAWSIDARLFGRKRIDIDRRKGKRPSL